MGRKLETVLSVVLAIAGVAIAASVVRRTFFPSSFVRAQIASGKPYYVETWKEAEGAGVRIGDASAPVTIVELADLECPACRGFQPTLQAVVESNAQRVSLIYVSYPLPMHRFALGAARAAECANEHGKFGEWVDAVYAKQDSLGLRSWGKYAEDAGISDTAAITKCATDPSPVARIEAGRAFGDKIHIRGTPTVIVDGWLFPYTPSQEELSRVIRSIAKGQIPFDTLTSAGA